MTFLIIVISIFVLRMIIMLIGGWIEHISAFNEKVTLEEQIGKIFKKFNISTPNEVWTTYPEDELLRFRHIKYLAEIKEIDFSLDDVIKGEEDVKKYRNQIRFDKIENGIDRMSRGTLRILKFNHLRN